MKLVARVELKPVFVAFERSLRVRSKVGAAKFVCILLLPPRF